jgi:hypothetical protein
VTILEKRAVMQAYVNALHGGANTHEDAVAAAAQQTCLPEEAVLEVVWEHDGEVPQ